MSPLALWTWRRRAAGGAPCASSRGRPRRCPSLGRSCRTSVLRLRVWRSTRKPSSQDLPWRTANSSSSARILSWRRTEEPDRLPLPPGVKRFDFQDRSFTTLRFDVLI